VHPPVFHQNPIRGHTLKADLLNQITACFDRTKVEEIGLKTGFCKRRRKIMSFNFFLAMTVAAAGKIKPSLRSYISAIKVPVSKEAFHHHANSDAAVEFMKQNLKLVTESQPGLNHKQIAGLDRFKAVKLFDSTQNPVSKRLIGKYEGRGDKATCKLQLCYEVVKGDLTLCAITSGRVPDQQYAKECPDFIEEGELAIVDLGYFSTKLFNAIDKKKAFFLTKLNWQTNVFTPTTEQKIALRKTASRLSAGSVHAIDVFLKSARSVDKVPCRLIIMKLPQVLADKKRRNLRKSNRHRGMQPSVDSLFWCGYLLLITNVPEAMLPAHTLADYYSVRWQIELLFKMFKSVLKLSSMNPVNEKRMLCETYGKVILGIILMRIHAAIAIPNWNKHRKTISFHVFAQHFADNVQELTHKLMFSLATARRWLNNQLHLWAKMSISPPRKKRPSTFEKLANLMETNEYLSKKIA